MKKITGLVLLAFCFFVAVSCDSSTGPGNSLPDYDITGTYTFKINNVDHTWLFSSNGTYEVTGNYIVGTKSGTWSSNGNDITISFASSGGGAIFGNEIFEVQENGEQITLSLKDNSATMSLLLVSFGLAARTVILTEQMNNGNNENDDDLLKDIDSISSWLSEHNKENNSISKPVDLSIKMQLTEANWKALLTAIDLADMYVALDLSHCTRSNEFDAVLDSNGWFYSLFDYDTGKHLIISLILPDTAIRLMSSFSKYFINLKKISSIAEIDVDGFYDCISLISADFPAAKSIATMAFSGCTNLTSIRFSALTTISYNPFVGLDALSFIITDEGSLSTIESGKALVRNNTELIAYPHAKGNITLNNINKISYAAFSNCKNLTGVSFPNVTNIDAQAFNNCSNLTSISIPEATSIGAYAFEDCSKLTNVSFSKVINIGVRAFYKCSMLASIYFPEATSINNEAFAFNPGLTNVGFPKVKTIGNWAFSVCVFLTNANFPECTSIGSNAFSSTENLSFLSIPKVTSIGEFAFASESTPQTIILGSTAPILSGSIFTYAAFSKNITVKVPLDAAGYGTIPQTYSGYDVTENWGNGFRGGGWTGTNFGNNGTASSVNSNVTINIVYQ